MTDCFFYYSFVRNTKCQRNLQRPTQKPLAGNEQKLENLNTNLDLTEKLFLDHFSPDLSIIWPRLRHLHMQMAIMLEEAGLTSCDTCPNTPCIYIYIGVVSGVDVGTHQTWSVWRNQVGVG